MKVLVDADACPVLKIVENKCKEKQIELIVVSDTNHLLELEYGKHIIVDQANDQGDYKIIQLSTSGDLVVTQDYGLASILLGKKVQVIHPKGMIYTNDNIDELLFSRYVSKKVRNSKQKNHLKGPSKRTKQDDDHFIKAFMQIVETGE